MDNKLLSFSCTLGNGHQCALQFNVARNLKWIVSYICKVYLYACIGFLEESIYARIKKIYPRWDMKEWKKEKEQYGSQRFSKLEQGLKNAEDVKMTTN